MRIFIAFEEVRLPLDVQPGQTVGDVKAVMRDHFKLNSSHAEDKVLQLFYAGAALHDTWVCSDLGISSGTTIKSALQDSDKPVLHINCPFNSEIVMIRDHVDLAKTTVRDLRRIVANKIGLPVSVFRLCSPDGKEMFDNHTMDKYKISLGSTLLLHVWDGWGDLLEAAILGHTKKVYKNVSSDDQVAKYQFRVVCYIAAHFGHVDLANSLINPKRGAVKPEEPVGQHPAKLWSKDSAHIDTWKCPVHEAAECGNVNVLRIFVQHNLCCLVSKDGHGHTPVQVCCKFGQTESLQYLTSKLYGSYTENNITLSTAIVIKLRKWSERARERALVKYGAFSSSLRRRAYKGSPIIGQGVIVDGYRESMMQSKSKTSELLYLNEWISENSLSQPGLYKARKILGHQRTKKKSDFKQEILRLQNFIFLVQDSIGDAVCKSSLASNRAINAGKQERHRAKAVGHRHQLRQSLRDVDEMTPPEDDSTDSASYIQTPKPGQKPGSKNFPIIGQASHFRSSRPTKFIDGVLPLPAVSAENTLRPFLHVSSKMENPVKTTIKIFKKYRGMTSRENAIQCMIVAGTFKDKAWLRQVDMAICLARRGVHNSLNRNSNDYVVKTLPTIAASPIKARG